MTQPHHPVANPFALLMDPQAVVRAIESSERLARLHSRICRPLDRPLLPHAAVDEVESSEPMHVGTEGVDVIDPAIEQVNDSM
jgi:hypothetical protein